MVGEGVTILGYLKKAERTKGAGERERGEGEVDMIVRWVRQHMICATTLF